MNRHALRPSLALCALALALPVAAHDDHGAQPSAEARFQALDINQDGLLTRYEYDTDVALSIADTDHDGRLSLFELEAVWGPAQAGEPSAADRIVIADLYNDGQLDDVELQRAVELRFTWLDRNHDGNLERSEVASSFGERVRPGD